MYLARQECAYLIFEKWKFLGSSSFQAGNGRILKDADQWWGLIRRKSKHNSGGLWDKKLDRIRLRVHQIVDQFVCSIAQKLVTQR